MIRLFLKFANMSSSVYDINIILFFHKSILLVLDYLTKCPFSIPLSTLDEQKSYEGKDVFSSLLSSLHSMYAPCLVHTSAIIYLYKITLLSCSERCLHTYHVKEKEYLFTLIHDKEDFYET